MSTAIERKKAQIQDALGWVEDLRGLNPTRQDIFFATNHVVMLQDDLKRLEEQQPAEDKKSWLYDLI